MQIEIYTITHKKYNFPLEKIYIPIVAGAADYEEYDFPIEYKRDDVGDNISNKHDLFSEYTINYWIWKNSTAEIVGINHYRRYFIRGNWLGYILCTLDSSNRIGKYRIIQKDIEDIFQQGFNCILPKKQWRVNRTMREEFDKANSPELLNNAEKIIRNNFQEYIDDFNKVVNAKENYQKCICIMSKEMFDDYSAWIFSIFKELLHEGFEGKNREFAFLGERLMNVWVEHNRRIKRLRIKELFFVNPEFSLKDIKQNYTEIILPKFLKIYLKMIAKLGLEFAVGDGHFRVKRKENKQE